MELKDYVETYREARAEKEAAQKELDDAKEAVRAAERDLVEKMVEDETTGIAVNGKSFSLVCKTQYSCLSDDTDELFGLLREDGLGDIVKEKVDSRTLSASMREIAEENGGELPEKYQGIIRAFDMQTISMRSI